MTPLPSAPFPGTGIFFDMPAATYHAVDACSATALKTIEKSPRHLFIRQEQGFEPTPATLLGTATHTATLEPDKLEASVLVAGQCEGQKADGGGCTNNGKFLSGGRWYCGVHGKKLTPDKLPALLDEDENLIESPIISAEAFDKAKAMARMIRSDRAARRVLESPTAKVEVSFFWEEMVKVEIAGKVQEFCIPCKMRADIYDPEGGPIIDDIKTCQCARRPEFESTIADRRYDIQAAWYLDGAAKATGGIAHDTFRFLAVESVPEHCVGVYRCHPELIGYGRYTYQALLQVYAYCKAMNRWPGYHDHREMECSLPPYFLRQEEREMKRVDSK